MVVVFAALHGTALKCIDLSSEGALTLKSVHGSRITTALGRLH